jgi:methyltransferase-like protein
MAEKDTIFSSKIKYVGIFNFKDFYQFCYEWLSEEFGLTVEEEEYSEKISGPVKNIDIKWKGSKKVSDYFKNEIKIEFKIIAMSEVEINQGGTKVKTNKGEVGVKVKGILVKDYEGKFETSAKMSLWRGIYEKWIIGGRVKEYEDKLAGDCDEFLGQAKAFLDISGQK